MSTEAHKSSIEAAQEAIAKVNAMLIAKGKLKPSQLSSAGPRKTGVQSNVITREVEINDVPIGCRNMLTRGATQEEISKLSGAAVATKGRYMSHEDKIRNPKERPLYLHVQGTSQDAINLAVGRINEIIANGLARQGPRMSRFAARASNQQAGLRHPPPPPPPIIGLGNTANQPPTMTLLQEKLYIGLEHAPPNFSVKDKVFGPGGAFLQHIQGETGAKVTLRGKGSGFIEATGGEAMEPMHVHLQHINMMGLQQAKELATNLIQTVQQEYAAFQQSFVSVPPPNMGIPQHSMLVPPPQLVSLAQPPPLLPGPPIMTSVPPPQQLLQPPQPQSTYMTPPPQATLTVSLPAPGVVIPQLAVTSPAPALASQPQPGQLIQPAPPVPMYGQPTSLGQPVQQYIQSSEPQIIGQIGNQPQVVVSLAPGQQGGQVVYTTVAGQPVQQPVQQIPQQLVPTGSVQIQQPQTGQIMQPGHMIQQPGIQPQQQVGLQQQITVHQQQPPQQQLLQQPQPTVISSSQPYMQQPMMQTTGAQIALPSSSFQPAHSPQQVSLGQPPVGQPVSWGAPATSYTTVVTGSAAPSMYSVVSQHTQNGDMIMTSPQSQTSVVLTSSSPSTVTSTPSGYVYKTGPVEEPKRRFTEEKQEDKLPEGLLGYEHGPPHLTNLMVQPGQSAQPPQPQQAPPQPPQQQPQQITPAVNTDPAQQQTQPQLIYGQQVLQPQQAELQQPPQQQQLMYSTQVVQQQAPALHQQPQQYTVVSQQQVQQQPQHIFQQPQQQQQQQIQQPQLAQIQEQTRVEGELQVTQGPTVTQGEPQSEDKVLMPPPPPPVVSLKRQSPGLQSCPEPRKKSKGFHEEDDDVDIPSSIASQAKEMKKFSFNQYSSTPQLYSTQTTTAFTQYAGTQNGSQSPGLEYQHEQQFQQQQQQQQPQQYIQDSQSAGQQYIGLSSPQQNVYGQAYTQYSIATSQAYCPTSAPQQQQPPPPPPPTQFDAQRSRSPDTGDKGRAFNQQFVPSYTRDENNLLRQPPPPPPPPSTAARPRTYW